MKKKRFHKFLYTQKIANKRIFLYTAVVELNSKSHFLFVLCIRLRMRTKITRPVRPSLQVCGLLGAGRVLGRADPSLFVITPCRGPA